MNREDAEWIIKKAEVGGYAIDEFMRKLGGYSPEDIEAVLKIKGGYGVAKVARMSTNSTDKIDTGTLVKDIGAKETLGNERGATTLTKAAADVIIKAAKRADKSIEEFVEGKGFSKEVIAVLVQLQKDREAGVKVEAAKVELESAKEKIKRIWIPQVIIICMLLWALNPQNPYSYYILLRWVCCGTFAYLMYHAHARENLGWTWVLGITALVYNPIIRVHLTREIWSLVNIITIIIASVSIFSLAKKTKDEDSSKIRKEELNSEENRETYNPPIRRTGIMKIRSLILKSYSYVVIRLFGEETGIGIKIKKPSQLIGRLVNYSRYKGFYYDNRPWKRDSRYGGKIIEVMELYKDDEIKFDLMTGNHTDVLLYVKWPEGEITKEFLSKLDISPGVLKLLPGLLLLILLPFLFLQSTLGIIDRLFEFIGWVIYGFKKI